MKRFKAVGIKNLKNNLSAYLREVKIGYRILVTERDEVIAEIRGPSWGEVEGDDTMNQPLYQTWVQEGKVRPPLSRGKKKGKLALTHLNLPEGTAVKLLAEDRGD